MKELFHKLIKIAFWTAFAIYLFYVTMAMIFSVHSIFPIAVLGILFGAMLDRMALWRKKV